MTDAERAAMAARGERPIPVADTGDRWPLAVETGAFHSGLRDAMADTRTPSEIAILNDQLLAERRVIDEQHARHNVAVTVCAGPEIKMLANIANDMEANSDDPRLVWMRNGNGRIIGVTLVGHLSTTTVSRSPELATDAAMQATGLVDHRPWHPLFGPCICSDCLQRPEGGR